MAKHSRIEISSVIEESTKGLDIEPIPLYTKVEQSKRTKRLQSVFPAHLEITGRASGKLYVWLKSGDVTDVDIEDVDELLQKRVGNSTCCGGSQQGNRLFQVIE